MSAQCQVCAAKAPNAFLSRDETNNTVVSQTVATHPNIAPQPTETAGIATP